MDTTYCSDIIISENYANFILERNLIATDYLKQYPDSCTQYIDNYAVLYRPLSLISGFNLNSVPYSTVPKLYGLMDTTAVDSIGSTRLQNIPSLELKGQGTIVGFIDTGIDFTHEAFINSTGRTRIQCIWDQTILSNRTNPDIINIPFGTIYDYAKINEAIMSSSPYSIVPSRDLIGHGTFLAGVCAGTPSIDNAFASVAPEADIVMVKLKEAKQYLRDYFFIADGVPCYQEDDIMSAVFFLLRYASVVQKPLIICIGLGSSQGAHIGSSPLASMLNNYSLKSGCAIAVAMGNEGDALKHFSGSIDTSVQYKDVEFRIGPDNSGIALELWGQPPELFSISVTSPSGETVPRIPARLGQNNSYYFLFDDTLLTVEYSLVENQSGAELILIRFNRPAEGIWKLRVFSRDSNPGRFNIWMPLSQFSDSETYFLESNPDITLTSPASAAAPMSVGAFDTRNNSLFLSSGRGFTAAGNVKPDFVAPGVNVYGPAIGGGYTNRSGTSISAAFTAGVAAQFMTWAIEEKKAPDLTGLSLKNYLIRGASRTSNEVYPNNTLGYGFLDAFNAFDIIRND